MSPVSAVNAFIWNLDIVQNYMVIRLDEPEIKTWEGLQNLYTAL